MMPNGLLPNVAAGVTRRIDAERWAVAEERTAELIARIQPTPASEARRMAVAHYVQRLIMGCLSCQVFTFGSVPLKTYLPDGDIDVTAFSNSEELKDTWAITVRAALEHEEKSENAEFRVREVQYIQAEMDNLINQNHLFKRSIILIKAWCYYESRILGAHHGLISTYALETLVLYIFLVFNNSFAGPLEVLYRFLEFFSNFDWEKFCVSLRGPVPISSLPDMAAEPPRDDDGALLLSRSFLDTCSTKYAVTPPIAQENHVQLFVSKHFNVVDPLRTNNNLGRSVSKGNFFRIRSAFAFGAKRLARLFECPKDDLAVEVEQFFTNTWRRHGSGNRPDAPAQSLIHQPMKVVPVEVPNSHRNTTIHGKKVENPTSCIGHDNLTGGGQDYHDPTTQLLNKASLQPWNSPRTVHSAVYPTQSQKIYGMQSNTKVSVQLETNSIPGGSLQGERDQSIPKTQFSMDERNGQSRLQFARTNSSPELTDSSVEGFPRGRRTRVVEVEKSSKVDYSRRSNLILGVHGNNIKKSSQDEQVSSVNASPNPSVSVSDLSSVSGSHYENICFATNEELASVTEASDMLHKRSQEEHDLADLMASTKLHSFNGQVPLPVQMPSRHSVAPSPMMASAGNSQGDLAGIFPPNFPFIRAPWLPNMQFVHGFVPPPMTRYAASPAFAPNSEDGNESERSVTTDMNCDDGSSWHENGAGLSGNFNQERIDPQMFNFDGKEHSPSLHDVPGAPLQWQLKSGIEDSGALRENYADMFHNQSSGGVSTSASSLSGCMGFVSSQASSRRKTLPDNSSHESTGKFLTSSRDKWGKRPAVVAPSSSSCSNTKTSECIPSELDGTRNSNLMPIVNSDFSDGIAGPIPSAQSRNSQVPDDHDPLQVSRHNPVFAPILIGSPQQGQDDNSGLTFVPTGPLVPYVVYSFIPGNTDGSVPQFERKEGMDQFPVNMSFGNFSSHDDADELDVNITSTASSSVISDHDGKSDILSSDITSHRQNLQYGRLCQNARPPASMNLQGHFPVDGPGRPPASNLKWAQVMGPGQRVVPVMDLQPASERASGVFQRYGEDAPRYRGGTGTYLPSPKVPFRDRQSSSRNHRGSYNSDRFYHSDKEGSWVNSKQRNVGRSYGRSPSEKSGTRLNRQTSDESKNDRQSQSYRNDSYRREAGGPSLVHSHSFGSTNPTRNPGNMTYGVYPQPSAASNGASALSGSPMQPVMMCSYDQGQGVNYGVSGEPIEFGSLGAIPMDGSDIQRPTHEVEANGFYEQRHDPYRGGSSRSSPDQPSSPHLRRS